MKNYLKLVNFEWNRFANLFFGLILVVFILQLGLTLFQTVIFRQYMPKISAADVGAIDIYDKFSILNVADSFTYLLTIVAGVVGLMFYLFFIWYRDWFARTSFAYRLLTLPVSRMSIFFAKLTTVAMSILGFLAFQLIFIKLFQILIKAMIPLNYRIDFNLIEVIRSSIYLEFFYPNHMSAALLKSGIGLILIVIIFTMILIERSYRWVGILYAVVYGVLNVLIAALPLFIQWISKEWFYRIELLWMEMGILLVLLLCGIFLSHFLINRKISV